MALTQLNVENLVNECRSCSSYRMQTFMDDILQGAACRYKTFNIQHLYYNSVALWQVKLKIQTFLLSAINCFISCIWSHEASDSDCVPNH